MNEPNKIVGPFVEINWDENEKGALILDVAFYCKESDTFELVDSVTGKKLEPPAEFMVDFSDSAINVEAEIWYRFTENKSKGKKDKYVYKEISVALNGKNYKPNGRSLMKFDLYNYDVFVGSEGKDVKAKLHKDGLYARVKDLENCICVEPETHKKGHLTVIVGSGGN